VNARFPAPTAKLLNNSFDRHGVITSKLPPLDSLAAGEGHGASEVRLRGIGPDLATHELTHLTTMRKAGGAGETIVNVARRMWFNALGDTKFQGVHPIYAEKFRADEIEARIREIAHQINIRSAWNEGSSDIETTRRFIAVQREKVRAVVENLAEAQIVQQGKSYTVKALDGSFEIALEGTGVKLSPSAQRHYVEAVLQTRLKSLDNFDGTLDRFAKRLEQRAVETPRE